VSMVARALHPGCQYRNVIIFEGGEDIGKSKLVKALASPEWYREVSHGLEGKEAHMIIQGAWVAELAELSSLSKTEENRLKSFITMESDDYVPKFSNLTVARKRRTIFIGTVNPEGDGTYLRGQTGNSRYLPISVGDIQIDDVLAIREQLFAEAMVYVQEHPADWWQLTPEAATEASTERDRRRHASIYQDSLAAWLYSKKQTTWEEIAQQYLLLEAKEKWKDKGLQMEIAKALRALGWWSQVTTVGKRSARKWLPPREKDATTT
jgi:predicted P-loop ATPase